MKRLFLTAMVAIAAVGYAQPGDRDRLTPDQQIELQTKRMTLDLNLTEVQQKEVRAALVEQNAFHQKKLAERKQKSDAKPTAEDRFRHKSEMLDRQIAHKAKMKKILNAEQFAKWEKSRKNRTEKSRDGMSHHKKSRGEGHRK